VTAGDYGGGMVWLGWRIVFEHIWRDGWAGVWARICVGEAAHQARPTKNSPTKPPTKLAHQARLLKNSPTKPPTKLAHQARPLKFPYQAAHQARPPSSPTKLAHQNFY